jgi:hypothetical protein
LIKYQKSFYLIIDRLLDRKFQVFHNTLGHDLILKLFCSDATMQTSRFIPLDVSTTSFIPFSGIEMPFCLHGFNVCKPSTPTYKHHPTMFKNTMVEKQDQHLELLSKKKNISEKDQHLEPHNSS